MPTDRRKIFGAADFRLPASGREIMMATPRREPVGAHANAGLVVEYHQWLGAITADAIA